MEIDVSKEAIGKFLEGRNPQKYIVGVEATYYSNKVDLIINDPKRGKYIVTDTFKPFIWMKHDAGKLLYGGDRNLTRQKLTESKIFLEILRVKNDAGSTPKRLEDGYKYLLTGSGSYQQLLKFFEDGGVDVFGEHKEYFMTLPPTEQFLIQSGKRLFKGFEDYNDIHRLQFDIETTGLDANKEKTFLIGIKDNRGYERVLNVKGNTPQELKLSEIKAIADFFKIVDELKPDIIAGYNSENFDFSFLNTRCERLGYEMKNFSKTLNEDKKLYFKKDSTLKLGAETEYYNQTIMWGYNVIDIAHAVRKAQAINSSIKKWGLKYITKFSGIAKPNRVYVPGDIIYKTWADKENQYAINKENGEWYKITEKKPLSDGYEITTGDLIVNQYLLDDLWETEQIDYIYNQASFLLSKILPTTYAKSSTMGTASIWKLIMCAWSYEKKLGVPALEPKREFTGGLSRLLEVGFAKNVGKLDYAALYPNTEITHNISPELDITNAMINMLLYIAESRDEFKELKNINAELAAMEKDPTKKKEYDALKSLYDKKQLPLKILANSFFGSFGAPYLFPWGDTDCAEETTCRGRQYLRLMVKFFTDRGFRALVMDTDGVNFAIPEDIDTITYVSDGTHRFNKAGQEYTGLSAVVAEFNDLYMEGRMGLDVDEVALATINFARKNYADLLVDKKGKTTVKLVGNTIKSKKMPGYIEDFLDVAVELLLNNNGYEFIEKYYEHVEKIYTYQIPLVKIASKGRVKYTMAAYNARTLKKNKAGNPLPKQAHMELLLNAGLSPDLGEMVYYVNTGTIKSDGDLKTVTIGKLSKKEEKEYFIKNGHYPKYEKEIILNCKLIPKDQIENDPDLTTDEYNVPKYLSAFNKRIEPLLVCFHPDIREKIMIDMIKDKQTKKLVLQERQYFTKKQAELCAGMPYETKDQDTYEDLMRMEDKEIYFWTKMEPRGIVPNHISKEDWESLKLDYLKRMREKRINDSKIELINLDKALRKLEVADLDKIKETGKIPDDIKNIVTPKMADNEIYFMSKTLTDDLVTCLTAVNYGLIGDVLFKFEEESIKRAEYYKTLDLEKYSKENLSLYEMWLEYLGEKVEIEEEIKATVKRNKKKTDDDNSEEELIEEDDDNPDDLEPNEPEVEIIIPLEILNRKGSPIKIHERTEDLNESDLITNETSNETSNDIIEVQEEEDDEWNF
jgi:DNA polymerase elongation subunit (family B)